MLHRMEKNYGPFMTADTVPAEKVLFIADIDRTVTVPAGEPLKTFDYALTEDAARLRIYPDRCLLSITHKASSKTFSIACPLRSDSPDDTPAYPADLTMQGIAPPGHILDHLLIFALSVAAVGKGILLIHASTIRYRGKAVMFLGESGTGKSTHSRMWLENIEGSTLLNDDAPAVRISADSTTAYGTPWSGKTPCYRAEHYPPGGPGPHPAGPLQSNHPSEHPASLRCGSSLLPPHTSAGRPDAGHPVRCLVAHALRRTGLYTRLPAQRRCRPGVVRSHFRRRTSVTNSPAPAG